MSLLPLLVVLTVAADPAATPERPNLVIIFCDDLGYADLGCFGAKEIATPHLDRMAAEGMRLTDFHVPAAVCSASRAALLTGCYPQRISILGALGPQAKHGIHAEEMLLPELLKARGYATAIYGKWHLGHLPQFLPTRHGFDDYYGLPYSNDMWPQHPTAKFPDLPLLAGEKVVNANVQPADQRQLTASYTEHAVKFIERHQKGPFFLYVPHSMPHVPLFASDRFDGKTGKGRLADVLAEIDDSVGQILATLKRLGLDERTLVVFTSDNGPWLSYGNHAGSASPLREGKGTTFEGGQRVPCIARWPGHIPAGSVCDELTTTMDLLPTAARLAGAKLPERKIDGHDIWPLLAGEKGAKSPCEAFYYYWDYRLEAVRSGQWKLHFPHDYRTLAGPPGKDGKPGPYRQAKIERALYDLASDVGESKDVAAEHPKIVRKLEALAEAAREDLGDALQGRKGKNVRPAGK